jgi:hypothetical protein
VKLAKTSRASSDPKGLDALYSSLHNAHREKMAKYEGLKKQKDVSDMEGCTFQPAISATKTWSKKKATSKSQVELHIASSEAKQSSQEKHKSISQLPDIS